MSIKITLEFKNFEGFTMNVNGNDEVIPPGIMCIVKGEDGDIRAQSSMIISEDILHSEFIALLDTHKLIVYRNIDKRKQKLA